MRILLIDDHALFRLGLQELLERRGINVIGVTGDSEEGIALAETLNPDVVLLDLRMPGMSGIEILGQLKKRNYKPPIVILTTSRENNDLVETLRSGAQGYLLKDMEPDELIAALNNIVNGETVVAQELTSVLAQVIQGKKIIDKPTPFSGLTPREREIICHLAAGQSNKVIAKDLGISDGTVKLHVKAILRKLDVHSRVEAAVLAVEHNICNRLLS